MAGSDLGWILLDAREAPPVRQTPHTCSVGPSLSFTGATTVPTSVVFGGLKVTAANTVELKACNVEASDVDATGLGITGGDLRLIAPVNGNHLPLP
jgi:hypothetical protein